MPAAADTPAKKASRKSPAQQRQSITDTERARILELHGHGLGRNAIAKETKLGWATVTKVVKDAGLSFDRSKTRQATQAKVDDTRARRAEVSALLLTRAHELLNEVAATEWLVFNFGGKDNTYEEHTLSSVPTGDKRNLVQAAATALGRHLDIERHDAEKGAADVRSMLGELGRALGVSGPPAE